MFHELGPPGIRLFASQDAFAEQFPGENDFIEFKQGVSANKVADAVVAFSNSGGGVIFLGIDNRGIAVGTDIRGEALGRVHRIIGNVRNPGRYELYEVQVLDRNVLAVSVRQRQSGFAQNADGRVLVRKGPMNTALFGDDLSRLIMSRSALRYELTPLPKTRFSEADPALVEAVCDAMGWDRSTAASRFVEAGLVDAGQNGPMTVAGVLFLTRRPSSHLGKAHVEVFRYRAGSQAYDQRVEMAGPVNEQIEMAARTVLNDLGSDVVVRGLHRYELPRIPEQVLREALANAVAHRAYDIDRQAVKVEIHPDYVSIRSPGGLPEPVTIANMRHQNSPRNVAVIRLLRAFGLAEDAGLGIDVMEDTMDQALLERPIFDADASHVSVRLGLGSTVTPEERAWVSALQAAGSIQAPDRLLLVHAARGEALTNSKARKLLDVDSTHARASLQRLRAAGLLIQHGHKGGATYFLDRSIGAHMAHPLSPDEIADHVLTMVSQRGRITNETVRGQIGVDRTEAGGILSRLVNAGKLSRHGQRRGTYYTLPDNRQKLPGF
ncbi:MAG: putative DNA binding domain-containing protein [Micrococcales bacterium]|nr:putative DNA binding domain-containing protein [Micrococcales bacterium]